jgi:hypothetical protein
MKEDMIGSIAGFTLDELKGQMDINRRERREKRTEAPCRGIIFGISGKGSLKKAH